MMQIKKPFTQELHFVDGSRQTIYDIVHIEQGNWYHIFTKKEEYYIINPDKILFVKIFGEVSDNIKEMINNDKKRFD